METQNENNTYELAYHLNPDLEEAGVKTLVQELSDLVTRAGGLIISSRAPQRIHLSYQIKNKQYGHFGIIGFTAPAEAVENLTAQMKLQASVLRYLLIKKPDQGKELRILGQHRARPRMVRTHEVVGQEAQKKAPKEKTKEETEQLEKDIEKVIEGL